MNRTTTYALLACLPVGGLLALGAHNRAVQAVEFVAVGSAGASVGWYGPRMALELHQDTVMRGRHRRASTTAARPRTAAAEPYRGHDEDDLERNGEQPARAEELPPSQRYAEQAEDEDAGDGFRGMRPRIAYVDELTLGDTQQITRVDPYLYPAPVAADRVELEVTDQDRALAAIHDDLAARGVWNVPVSS
jgi:hypothetical protein